MRNVLAAVTCLLALGASPLTAQSSLTIYSDGRVLARREFPRQLPAGLSTHRLDLGAIDPGSIFSTIPGVSLTQASYDAAVDEQNTLRRAVGRELVFETGGRTNGVRDTVIAYVVGVQPERFRLPDGRVTFQRPGTPRYPAELILVNPTLDVTVHSAEARSGLPLAWFTGGASWEASYSVVLAGSAARISGMAAIPSSGLAVANTEIQLLAGSVGRARSSGGIAMDQMRVGAAREEMAFARQAASEESIGEVHLYSLPGRHTLVPGLTTTSALFEPATSGYLRRFVLRGALPWHGGIGQIQEEVPQPVEVVHVLRRGAETTFGKLPMPAGVWRLYQADQAGRLQLIGEAAGRHTAQGQDLELSAGSAFNLTARRIQTEYTVRRDSLKTRVRAGYQVTIANGADSVATVEVMEERAGEWRLLSSSRPAERLSSSRTRFKVTVPARGEAVLRYLVEVSW